MPIINNNTLHLPLTESIKENAKKIKNDTMGTQKVIAIQLLTAIADLQLLHLLILQ